MSENIIDIIPKVVIDVSKYRIRIHRTTIKALGNPKYVLLLVNPDEKTMGIMPTERDDRKGLRIKYNGLSCEIYSTPLVDTICELTGIFKLHHRYIIDGKMIATKKVALFELEKATAFNNELQFEEV